MRAGGCDAGELASRAAAGHAGAAVAAKAGDHVRGAGDRGGEVDARVCGACVWDEGADEDRVGRCW